MSRYISGAPGADHHSSRATLPDVDAPDVDEAYLDGLALLCPAARFTDMLGIYLENSRARLERVEFFAIDKDMEAIVRESHDLKSTSGNFGARRLQYLAEQLEVAGKAGDIEAVMTLLPSIRVAADTAWAIIAARRTSPPKASRRAS